MKFEFAVNYDKFALPQRFVASELIKTLTKYKKTFLNIYEIGAGSGLATREIISNLNFQTITLNDIYMSKFMGKFNTQIGDISALNLPKNIDLFISSSVFQWIENLNLLSQKLYANLLEDGIIAFGMFSDRTLDELSSFTKQGLQYHSKDEIEAIFSNFLILDIKNDKFIAKFNSLKELLNHLKQTGVNNIKGNFKLTKSKLTALEAHFNGKFELTYSYTILIAKKVKNAKYLY